MNMGHCNDNKKQENNKLLEEYMSRCHFLLHKSHMVCSSTEFRPLGVLFGGLMCIICYTYAMFTIQTT